MVIFAGAALAATQIVAPACTIGTWTTSAGGTAIFEIAVANTAKGLAATWSRPAHFSLDGDEFSGVAGPVVHQVAGSARLVGNDLEISFDDPRPGATADIFRLRCVRSGHLEVTYDGAPYQQFDFVRAASSKLVLGPWDATQTYVRKFDRPTNAEMTSIFVADQAAREPGKIDWSVVGPADEQRRRRTKALLDSGALQSADDYYHAAFIFQHGDSPNDYLLAHLLAMIAVARGKSAAIWIASATLDRYLINIGKRQVLGTQYSLPKGQPATQEPYDRTLISDAMRRALQVPSLAEQEKQREVYSSEAGGKR